MITPLLERFPDISLHLSLTPFKKWTSARSATLEIPHLEDVEVLYVYGLADYYEQLEPWLREGKGRNLVIIEDDIAAIDAFLNEAKKDFFVNPRVHLRYIPEPSKWRQSLESLAHLFPSDRIIFAALPTMPSKKVSAMRLYMQRTTALIDALFTEVLNSHSLFKNLYPNFKRIPSSFFVNRMRGRFANMPAIICGAGPSLSHAIESLKGMESKALIIGGGSTITALTAKGIVPHIGMALDPNPLEYVRLKGSTAFENPFIFAPRLYSEVFALCNGPYGYLRSDTGGEAESWLEQKLDLQEPAIGPDLGREALSVTTLAVATAYALGCNPIIFAGVDLAFTGNQTYATGVVADQKALFEKIKKESKSIDQLVRKKDRKGKSIYSLIKWVMESATISDYAKNHPETQFINCTEGGIGFPHIEYVPIQEALEAHCKISYDLRGLLHTEMQHSQFDGISEEQITGWFAEVKESLHRLNAILDEMTSNPSSGKMAVLEMDFQEEVAFECLFQAVGPALDRIMERFAEASFEEKATQYRTMVNSYIMSIT